MMPLPPDVLEEIEQGTGRKFTNVGLLFLDAGTINGIPIPVGMGVLIFKCSEFGDSIIYPIPLKDIDNAQIDICKPFSEFVINEIRSRKAGINEV